MLAKLTFALSAEAAVLGLLLLGAAGRVDWPEAWIYLALFWLPAAALSFAVARSDPALIAERLKPPFQKGQPIWDRVFLVFVGLLFIAWEVAMGLDAGRYRWSHMPLWLEALGAAAMLVSWWLNYRVFQANTFLAPVVRVQTERGQHVISTGPYAVVRHPLYSGAALLIFGSAFELGSWLGVALAGVLAVGIAIRALGEERELRANLPGYADYAARVRYRLVPYIW